MAELSHKLNTIVKRLPKLSLSRADYASGMDDIFGIRHKNLLALLAKPPLSALPQKQQKARALDMSQSMFSQITNPAYKIGEELARKIEVLVGLEYGWLDNSGQSQAARIDPAILLTAEGWVGFEEGLGAVYRPVERAKRVVEVYSLLEAVGGDFSPHQANDFIERAKAKYSQGERDGGAKRRSNE